MRNNHPQINHRQHLKQWWHHTVSRMGVVPLDTRGWAGGGGGGPSGGSPTAGVTQYTGSPSPGGCQGGSLRTGNQQSGSTENCVYIDVISIGLKHCKTYQSILHFKKKCK